MSSPRDRAVAAAALLGAYHRVARPRLNRLGATRAEAAASYPGDELIPNPNLQATMATTIAAPPAAVWPWLVQMGADRAGFYSWDRLDNGGRPSAERIHPEWQDLEEGGRVVAVPNGDFWFNAAIVVPERTLVLRASLTLTRPRPFNPRVGYPRAFSDSIWSFHLSRTGPGDSTRLVVRTRGYGRPRFAVQLTNALFWEPAHWIMQVRQFTCLRRRAERAAIAGAGGSAEPGSDRTLAREAIAPHA